MPAALSTDDSHCAPGAGGRKGVCSSKKTTGLLAEFVVDAGGAKPRHGAEAVAKAAAALGCGGERCVLEHPRLANFAAGARGKAAAADLKAEARARFKPAGPRDSAALLSNFDIDGVLSRWAGEARFAEFFNCPFAMMDFEREAGYVFGQADSLLPAVLKGEAEQAIDDGAGVRRVRRKCSTFACVLNTDVSTGTGKHWVCVFVDMRGEPSPERPWTVEYFNSAGNPPPRAVTRWMARAADSLLEMLGPPGSKRVVGECVTSVTHQRSLTECGPYSLFYIRARLDGVPHSHFSAQRTSDAEMRAFRRHLFSSAD